jgi:hypothetical protein
VLKIGWGYIDWIHLAQDKDQWWTLVNTVIRIRVPKKNLGNFLVVVQVVASQEELIFIKLVS